MDGARFDDLTRRLAVALSRRGMLRLLGGSLAGAVFTSLMPVRPVRGLVMQPGLEELIIKQLFGDDLEDLQLRALHDKEWQQLLGYARKVLGLYPGGSTAWATDLIDATRCVSFLRTVLVTPAGEEAASLQWVGVERPGTGIVTIPYLLQASAESYAVTNGEVRRISTDAASMPWPRIRQVCQSACQLVREGKSGQAPCDVVVPLMELCVSKILGASGLRQLAFELTLAVKTVCTAMRLGCALGDCAVCDPPCGPNQQCLESGNAGPLCCECPSLGFKCCVTPDGIVFLNGCCPVYSVCTWVDWPASFIPGCSFFPKIQCQPPWICTN